MRTPTPYPDEDVDYHVSSRAWLTPKYRADLAKSMGCAPEAVEAALDSRERMEAYMAERREREAPFGGARR